jgi:hypothetical protein
MIMALSYRYMDRRTNGYNYGPGDVQSTPAWFYPASAICLGGALLTGLWMLIVT